MLQVGAFAIAFEMAALAGALLIGALAETFEADAIPAIFAGTRAVGAVSVLLIGTASGAFTSFKSAVFVLAIAESWTASGPWFIRNKSEQPGSERKNKRPL